MWFFGGESVCFCYYMKESVDVCYIRVIVGVSEFNYVLTDFVFWIYF